MKISQTAKDILAGVAPAIAGVIGGPAAGLAVKILADKLNAKKGDGSPDTKAIEAAIASGDPETALKLAQANNEFILKCEEIGLKYEELSVEDRKNARDLAKLNMWPQIVLSTVFIAGYFTLLYWFFFGEITIAQEWKSEATMLLGILTVNVPIIMHFWFGSSSGSARKTTLLAKSPPVEE